MARKGFASTTIHESVNTLVEELAKKLNRKKSWVIEQAILYYIQQSAGGTVPVQEIPETP